jgi:hypothetical protein
MKAKIVTKRRFATHSKVGKPLVLKPDHDAIVNATTLFPNRIKTPDFSEMLFKSGVHNRKIGSRVTKGEWAGMPIFTLTLTERATCPTICENWFQCYGNKMQWPTRWKAGEELERIIPGQIATLSRKHPDGFVIRLHVLGDFMSTNYVRMWNMLMANFSALRVYGYTRREKDSSIGKWLDQMNGWYPDRWRVRWSERGGEMGTVTTKDVHARGRTADGIVCPAQTEGDEVSCSSCGLCWGTTESIVFVEH